MLLHNLNCTYVLKISTPFFVKLKQQHKLIIKYTIYLRNVNCIWIFLFLTNFLVQCY